MRFWSSSGSMTNGLSSLLWFIAILALIPITLWFLKRTSIGGASGPGLIRSVAALPISASQRIVTVEVGHGDARRWLVLGVTPTTITTLHSMEPQADSADAAGPPAALGAGPAFAQVLARLRRTRGEPL